MAALRLAAQPGSLTFHWYEQRHWPQIVCSRTLAAALASAVMAAARRRLRSITRRGAGGEGRPAVIGCWMVEVISLHATDSILYHPVGRSDDRQLCLAAGLRDGDGGHSEGRHAGCGRYRSAELPPPGITSVNIYEWMELRIDRART